jgi:hypothetical protein
MIHDDDAAAHTGPSAFERTAGAVVRTGLACSAAALIAGIALFVAGRQTADLVLAVGIVMLVTLPLVNVLALLTGEIRRREWPFAAATCAVLALLLLTLVWKAG